MDSARLPAFMRVEKLKRMVSLGRRSPPLWWYPSLALIGGLLVGVVLSRFHDIEGGAFSFIVYNGGAEAGRSFVTMVASAIASITTLTLTLTVVSLQLASSQYSPRLVEQYLSDRTTHAVFSLFLATFALSIATLLNIRLPSDKDTYAGQVPGIAISVLVVMVVSCLGGLVFFVYRVTTSIRIETVLLRTRNRAVDAIRSRDHDGREDPSVPVPQPPPDGGIIRSRRSGFFAAIDRDSLSDFGHDGDVTVWVVAAPGDFITEGSPVAVLDCPLDDDLADEVESWMQFDAERWIESDYTYGVRNLVDIALRALSPGINDPTTAQMAVDRIGEVMAEAGRHHPNRVMTTDAGSTVYLAIREWGATLQSAVRQIMQYGNEDVEVVAALTRMLAALAWTTSDVDRTPVIREIFDELHQWFTEGTEQGSVDARRLAIEFQRVEAALAGRIFEQPFHQL